MKIFIIFLLTLLSSIAQTQAQPQQLMLNISASGEVSADPLIVQIACTIVSGQVPIAVLAEAETPGTDAALVLVDVSSGESLVVDDNDDFATRSPDDLELMARVLRLPRAQSDALAIGIADDQAICAIATEVRTNGGSGLINLQINDLSSIASLYDNQADDSQDVGTMLSFLKFYAPLKRISRHTSKHTSGSLTELTLSRELIEKMLAAAAIGQQPER